MLTSRSFLLTALERGLPIQFFDLPEDMQHDKRILLSFIQSSVSTSGICQSIFPFYSEWRAISSQSAKGTMHSLPSRGSQLACALPWYGNRITKTSLKYQWTTYWLWNDEREQHERHSSSSLPPPMRKPMLLCPLKRCDSLLVVLRIAVLSRCRSMIGSCDPLSSRLEKPSWAAPRGNVRLRLSAGKLREEDPRLGMSCR